MLELASLAPSARRADARRVRASVILGARTLEASRDASPPRARERDAPERRRSRNRDALLSRLFRVRNRSEVELFEYLQCMQG